MRLLKRLEYGQSSCVRGKIFFWQSPKNCIDYVGFVQNMLNYNQYRSEAVCHERLQHLAAIALDVVETLLTDTETPVNVRLNAAFRIFELCNSDINHDMGQAIIQGIEKNARDIEKNAHGLSNLETLLKSNIEKESSLNTIEDFNKL
jgi:hypothetical protein